MYIVKLKIGYSEYEFKYDDWDECSFIIKSLTEHNANKDFCVEVFWEPVKSSATMLMDGLAKAMSNAE